MNRVMAFFYYFGMVVFIIAMLADMSSLGPWALPLLVVSLTVLVQTDKRVRDMRPDHPAKALFIGNAVMWGGSFLLFAHCVMNFTNLMSQH